MKTRLVIASFVACLTIAAAMCPAAPFEFAQLDIHGTKLTWMDKNGVQSSDDLFSKLSGKPADQANQPQAAILVLDGLGASGWTVVQAQGGVYLLQRDLAAAAATQPSTSLTETQLPLQFSGGYDTDPADGGRPVVLIAAALNVPAEVFRDAFAHVHPAGPGQQPQPDQVRENKRALMDRLSSYGVTNDRLDAVSNYYRYQRSAGEMWKHVPAKGYAVISGGTLKSIVLTDHGAGYSSRPNASVEGMPGVHLKVTLQYGTDLATNGSIKSIEIESPTGTPANEPPNRTVGP
ncbi:MAG: hypothetical protein JO353_01645 [Phycisphaerae bacterium]|nr:hypothetical protein [Phycisphaerae bacterium]